jgi:hypothetical protein
MRSDMPRRGRRVGKGSTLSAARLDALIAEALVDAYGDSEERTAFYTLVAVSSCASRHGSEASPPSGFYQCGSGSNRRGMLFTSRRSCGIRGALKAYRTLVVWSLGSQSQRIPGLFPESASS